MRSSRALPRRERRERRIALQQLSFTLRRAARGGGESSAHGGGRALRTLRAVGGGRFHALAHRRRAGLRPVRDGASSRHEPLRDRERIVRRRAAPVVSERSCHGRVHGTFAGKDPRRRKAPAPRAGRRGKSGARRCRRAPDRRGDGPLFPGRRGALQRRVPAACYGERRVPRFVRHAHPVPERPDYVGVRARHHALGRNRRRPAAAFAGTGGEERAALALYRRGSGSRRTERGPSLGNALHRFAHAPGRAAAAEPAFRERLAARGHFRLRAGAARRARLCRAPGVCPAGAVHIGKRRRAHRVPRAAGEPGRAVSRARRHAGGGVFLRLPAVSRPRRRGGVPGKYGLAE